MKRVKPQDLAASKFISTQLHIFRVRQSEQISQLILIIKVLNLLNMSEGVLSPLRKIKLFFPPIDSPLLTTYGKSLLPQVSILK